MSFSKDYIVVKHVVADTLGISWREADEWLVKHTELKIGGTGARKVVAGNKRTMEAFRKILGPHGPTLIKATDRKS